MRVVDRPTFSMNYEWRMICLSRAERSRQADNDMAAAGRRRKNAQARITRPHQNGKAGRRSGEQAQPPHRWTRRSNSADREGLPDSRGGIVSGRSADRKLSLPRANRLRKDSYRGGGCRITTPVLSTGDPKRLRGIAQ